MMAGIGPQLPPHLMKKLQKQQENQEDKEAEEEKATTSKGPMLPPHLKKKKEEKDESIRPQLPPEIQKSNSDSYGPALPPGLVNQRSSKGKTDNEDEDEDDNEDVIGPSLPFNLDSNNSKRSVEEEFEARAKAMKNKLTGKNDSDKMERENWMLELPPELSKNFGLGPRTFRSKAVDLGDRSVWTDTPADRERKLQERRDAAMAGDKRKIEKPKEVAPTKEELEMQKRVQQYNEATRPKSLLEMHQSKQQKTSDESGTAVRRPFDRERDLNVRQSDPKATAKFIKDAKGLNTKFSTSSYTNKFL